MFRKVLSDVLGHASWVRANASSDEGLMPAAASPKRFHLPVVVSLAGHALLLILFLRASWNYVTQMGSVRVLKTSGPVPFTTAAKLAIQRWVYRPVWFENRPFEVVSRVEVRFDSDLAESRMSP